jgi:hypothetical protein
MEESGVLARARPHPRACDLRTQRPFTHVPTRSCTHDPHMQADGKYSKGTSTLTLKFSVQAGGRGYGCFGDSDDEFGYGWY